MESTLLISFGGRFPGGEAGGHWMYCEGWAENDNGLVELERHVWVVTR
jgi:hypothetical protein